MLPLLLLAGGVGFLIYNQKQTAKPMLNPNASPGRQPQPSQRYPMQMVPVARVDNANQPWSPYVPSLMGKAMGGGVGGNIPGAQGGMGAGLAVGAQASQIWNNLDLGSYFSSGASSDNTDVATDDVQSYPSIDYGGAASDVGGDTVTG